MTVFARDAKGERIHIIRQKDGSCEGCSVLKPGDRDRFPDLHPLLEFRVREKDPPLHEVFLVRMKDGALAAVCLYCPRGVVFDMGDGRDAIAQTALGHIRAQRTQCLDCELGFPDEGRKDRHDTMVHRPGSLGRDIESGTRVRDGSAPGGNQAGPANLDSEGRACPTAEASDDEGGLGKTGGRATGG